MAKQGKFSTEEIDFLKENYCKLDIQEICNILDRTKDSIRYKASKLKLKSRNIFEELKEILKDNNYEMLSSEYLGIKAHYDIRCIKHDYSKKSTGDCILQDRYGCPYCKSEKIHTKNITDINIVREEFIKKGLIPKFEDDDYIDNKTPLKYLCPIHNEDYQYITYDSLRRSMFGCVYCAGKFRGENYCGEKHHMWKGGIVNPKQKLRETPDYKQWLKWAIEIQALAQNGLTYTKDVYDKERFERLREISAEMLAEKTDIPVDKVKDLFCNEKGYQTPKLDTRAAIFKDGKILLVHENNGTWALPGGWVDVLESVGSNTIKEVKEETGLDVRNQKIIAIQDRNQHNTPSYAYGICKVFVLCELLGGEFKENTETTEIKYFSLDEIPQNLANEKTSMEQIEMCFRALNDSNWQTKFD